MPVCVMHTNISWLALLASEAVLCVAVCVVLQHALELLIWHAQ